MITRKNFDYWWVVALGCGLLGAGVLRAQTAPGGSPLGFRDFARQAEIDARFMVAPDARLAEEHLRILTAEPHIAGSPEDKKTADYVAEKFRAAGLATRIVEYKIWLNYPGKISVDATAPAGLKMHGPSPEHVDGDPFQSDSRVTPGFNGFSPSGDAEAEVIYANYGRPEDIRKLESMGISVRGKILLVRYGNNFRGVKTFVAQEHGAAGVLIYSDPMDDGYFKGDKYPKGPWRPDSAVQRGSIGYMFKYPGDPTTPGIASLPSLDPKKRTPPAQAASLPAVPTTPLSYGDAGPLLANLGGPVSPRDWQGALPFTYHVGPGPVRVKMHLQQDYAYRTIWDVIGTIPGTDFPDQVVVGGNHRDAWVYGAVDPNSGTAAMLETVHGLGVLLKSGWKPRRTIIIGSWDAEEEGLIGSTEWGEEHAADLEHATAYFNMDVGVAGPHFGSSAVPSLKRFVREVTKQVPSPKGGTVYEQWRREEDQKKERASDDASPDLGGSRTRPPEAKVDADVDVGDLGSGSDYTVFLQRLGVPSTDIGSGGDYGVYHSVFDNFAWFKKFGDPTFVYEQQMARVFGIEILHMSGADVVPYDYETYGKEITVYLETAKKKAERAGKKAAYAGLKFDRALQAARRFTAAGVAIGLAQQNTGSDAVALNRALIAAERGLLLPEGLPNRPWFRHSIYAPGQYTGYAAVVIPGVNEAVDAGDGVLAAVQLEKVAQALDRAAGILEAPGALLP